MGRTTWVIDKVELGEGLKWRARKETLKKSIVNKSLATIPHCRGNRWTHGAGRLASLFKFMPSCSVRDHVSNHNTERDWGNHPLSTCGFHINVLVCTHITYIYTQMHTQHTIYTYLHKYLHTKYKQRICSHTNWEKWKVSYKSQESFDQMFHL